MGPAIGGGAGLLLGAVKHNQDLAAYNRQKEMAAQMQQYSPWTGQSGVSFMPQQRPSLFGSLMQGAVSGGMMGGNIASMMPSASAAAPVTPSSPTMSSPWSGVYATQDPNSFWGQDYVPTLYGAR